MVKPCEQARLAVALGGVAFAGRAVIFAQREKGRLPGSRFGLLVVEPDQVAPEIAAAVDVDKAGTWHDAGSFGERGGRRQAASSPASSCRCWQPCRWSAAR